MKFTLQPEDKVELEKLAKSGMTPVIISQRAKILLKKAENKSSTVVAGEIGAKSIVTVGRIKPCLIS